MKSQLNDQELIKLVFRQNPPLASRLKNIIWKYARAVKEREKCDAIKIMNFCGTHEWTTAYYGLRSLVPPFLELIPGPGCPVCIVPSYYVEVTVKLAREGMRVYTYGDSLRLRSARSSFPASLLEARADGGDVKVVYSFLDAVRDSRELGKESVFFGIGFETTAPSYALMLKDGKVPENLKFLSVLRLTPPAMEYTIEHHKERGLPIRGVIAPGHVSTIVGAAEWEFLPKVYGLPTVVAGFEPIDVLMAIAQILLMIKEGKPAVKIEYKRIVKWNGNEYAKRLIEEVFERASAAWRGMGFIPRSGLKLKDGFYEKYDALMHFDLPDLTPERSMFARAHSEVSAEGDLPPGCRCGEVIIGAARPTECPLFMKGCSPMNPWGPCMVSAEGACAIWARYGKSKLEARGG